MPEDLHPAQRRLARMLYTPAVPAAPAGTAAGGQQRTGAAFPAVEPRARSLLALDASPFQAGPAGDPAPDPPSSAREVVALDAPASQDEWIRGLVAAPGERSAAAWGVADSDAGGVGDPDPVARPRGGPILAFDDDGDGEEGVRPTGPLAELAAERLARSRDRDRPPGQPPDRAPVPPVPGGRLTRLAGGAFDPGRRGLRALAVVAVVVLLGAAVLAWWSRPRPESLPPELVATAPTDGVPSDGVPAGAAPAGGPPAATPPAELVVAVSGEVREPGLVRLPPGSRVADAIDAAGGLLPGADIDHLNLARLVADGELIAVGIPPPPGQPAGPPAPGSGPSGAAGSGSPVNLNTATAAELETLPGIGPALAQRIIDHRTQHGPFTAVGQLRQVSGIGEARYAELESLVTV